MSQFSYSIADEAGAAFLADVNSALQANASMNSGSSAPSTIYGNLLWVDTGNSWSRKRNNANGAWNVFADKDWTTWLLGDGTVGAPAYSFNGDPDTGFYRIGSGEVGFSSNNGKILDIGSTGIAITGVGTFSGNVAVGSATPAGSAGALEVTGKAYILRPAQQLLLAYDASNSMGITAQSNGRTDFNATGSGAKFAFDHGIFLPAGTTALASLNITLGVAPTSPTDGDIWYESGSLKFRLSGVTKSINLV